jgi:hypothetical protein
LFELLETGIFLFTQHIGHVILLYAMLRRMRKLQGNILWWILREMTWCGGDWRQNSGLVLDEGEILLFEAFDLNLNA